MAILWYAVAEVLDRALAWIGRRRARIDEDGDGQRNLARIVQVVERHAGLDLPTVLYRRVGWGLAWFSLADVCDAVLEDEQVDICGHTGFVGSRDVYPPVASGPRVRVALVCQVLDNVATSDALPTLSALGRQGVRCVEGRVVNPRGPVRVRVQLILSPHAQSQALVLLGVHCVYQLAAA